MSVKRRIRFQVGEVCATAHVLASVSMADIAAAVSRHQLGDWGELGAADRKANDDALQNRTRLLSAYSGRNGTKFWIITEVDRSVTTILLPNDY